MLFGNTYTRVRTTYGLTAAWITRRTAHWRTVSAWREETKQDRIHASVHFLASLLLRSVSPEVLEPVPAVLGAKVAPCIAGTVTLTVENTNSGLILLWFISIEKNSKQKSYNLCKKKKLLRKIQYTDFTALTGGRKHRATYTFFKFKFFKCTIPVLLVYNWYTMGPLNKLLIVFTCIPAWNCFSSLPLVLRAEVQPLRVALAFEIQY